MRQITKEEAIKIYENELYEDWSFKERAEFQLRQDKLCMPFQVFYEAISKALNRDVYTHEFGLNRQGLIAELCGEVPSPTLEEVIELIPEEKRILVFPMNDDLE